MTKVMEIDGMRCRYCTGKVQSALEAIEGVREVFMSLEDKTAAVELGAEVADKALKAAVEKEGYIVKKILARNCLGIVRK